MAKSRLRQTLEEARKPQAVPTEPSQPDLSEVLLKLLAVQEATLRAVQELSERVPVVEVAAPEVAVTTPAPVVNLPPDKPPTPFTITFQRNSKGIESAEVIPK